MDGSESSIAGGRRQRPAAARMAVVGLVLAVAVVVGCGRTHRGARDLPTQRSTRPSATLLWTSPLLPGAASDGSFGPDGERLAVVVGTRPTGHPDGPWSTALWLVDAKHAAPLAGTEGATSPDWSPAGGLVAFLALRSSRTPADKTGPDGWNISAFHWDISVFDVGARQAHRVALPKSDHLYGPPRWSPDGSRLACGLATVGPQQAQTAVAIVDVARGRARTYSLASSAVTVYGPPAWNAGGAEVLVPVAAVHGTGSQATTRQEIWLVEASTGHTRRVYARSGTMPIPDATFASPDGTPCLALLGTLEGRDVAVLLRIDTEESEPTEVARMAAPAGWRLGVPHIPPDGRSIAATVSPPFKGPGAGQPGRLLWAHDGRAESIGELPPGSHYGFVAWSQDGRRLAVSYGDGTASRIAVHQLTAH